MFQQPGSYWPYRDEYGTRPATFSQNPKFAQLVREGSLPPLDERLPVPEDVYVFAPPDEVGVYGGQGRIITGGKTSRFLKFESFAGNGTCMQYDADGVNFYPLACESVSLSEDGRTYTIALRDGLKWSDGMPMTMQDVEWVWNEDVQYNAELNKSYSGSIKDPITGNVVQFNKIDDLNFTLSFDSPNFTFLESGRFRQGQGCTRTHGCMFEPFHYSKEFHPKYADPAAFKKIMDDKGYDDWTQVWKGKYSVRYDEDVPFLGHFYNCEGGNDDSQTMCANPYFHGVDPAGNQLPYMDSYTWFLTESRDTSIFRSMAGETDGPYNANFVLYEMPLYIGSMEKGDYSIGHWPETSGNDAGTQINTEYNTDAEIGRLFRTPEFREALNLGMDRNEINEVVFLGLGTPQAWVPHPSTAFYPGDEWRQYNAIRDVAKANQLLDSIGLVDTDGDGIRNRNDNGENLVIFSEFREEFVKIAELFQSQWAEVGVRLDFKAGRNRAYGSGEAPIRMRSMPLMTNMWVWTQFLPYRASHPGREMGRYFETRGKEGMAPVGAAQVECTGCSENEYLPLAPAGNYPADPTGFLMEMQNLYGEGRSYQMLDPRRIAIGKRLYELNLENDYHFGSIGFTGSSHGIVFKRNNVRNVPNRHMREEAGGYGNMLIYFEDGIDNTNHPGNRSGRYASTHFLECVHIASDKC
jgi:peptide/nickel transport system substrate-binding protein